SGAATGRRALVSGGQHRQRAGLGRAGSLLAIMPRMPKSNPPQDFLPFPDLEPGPGPRQAGGPAPDESSPPPPRRSPRPPRDPRPWWARLLARLLDPWIALDVVPETPGEHIDASPVCYVLED